MELHPVGDAPDLRGACVVLPAVAFFNVGELAVDALIATLRARLAGRLGDPNLLAVVGNDAFDHAGEAGVLATALELYSVPGSKLFLLQQRAPAIPGRQAAFCADLAQWLAASGVGQVVILTGLDAQYRRESQLEGPQFRSLTASDYSSAAAAAVAPAPGPAGAPGAAAAEAEAEAAVRRGLAGLALSEAEAAAASEAEGHGAPRLEADALARELELHSLLPPWPLLGTLAAARGAPALLLGRFAAEGDNVPDALALAGLALRLLSARGLAAAPPGAAAGGAPRLATPPSWAGLYGRPYEEVA